MAKGRRGSERTERLDALFAAGDHGAARRLAGETMADAAATQEEREAALALLRKLAPDRAVTVAAIAGVVTALAISAWMLSR